MKLLLNELGIYFWPAVIGLLEIILALVLGVMLSTMRTRSRKNGSQKRGEQIYGEVIGKSSEELHILIRHDSRRVLFMTENVSEMTGIRREQLEADILNLAENMEKSAQRDFSVQINGWDRKKSLSFAYFDKKKQVWMRISVQACGDTPYDLFIIRDITEEKDREELMEKKIVEAELVSQSKTTFLSRMSHEIRTPMNGIKGMLTLIRKQPHNEVIEQYLDKTDALSGYMLSLINEILDLSRIENGKLELEQEPFDIREIASEVADMFQKNVQERGIGFLVDASDFQHYRLEGDRLRVSQILTNLISNAQKFTEQGEIKVIFKEMMYNQGQVSFLLEVSDTGKGMDPKFVSRLFLPFEQENAGIAGKYGGSGLGMAITDQIVKLMGGEIIVDTYPGKGTDFKVYLTLQAAPETSEAETVLPVQEKLPVSPKETAADAFSFAGKHILVAEDNAINAEIATYVLQDMGAEVQIAGDGGEVIEIFRKNPPGTFDFILMDIQMPVMDGREAARTIRGMDREDAKTISIYALSADAFVEDQRLSVAAGMNGHFAKPVNFEELEKEIGKLEEQRS